MECNISPLKIVKFESSNFLAKAKKYRNLRVTEREYVSPMTKTSKIFFRLLISVVNEVGRKLSGILIQKCNRYGD
jgi:hypothetical protein